jgi:hypothetical protein
MVWRMPFTCWINKATNTHFEYVIRIEFAQQSQFRQRASVFVSKYIACLVSSFWQVLLRWQASCFLHRILRYDVSGDLLHLHTGWLSTERNYLNRNHIEITNKLQSCTRIYYSNILLIAEHISSDTPLIIRSSKIVIAAFGFTYVCGCRPLSRLSGNWVGIINSSTWLHLVGYWYMNCTMIHETMNIKYWIELDLFKWARIQIVIFWAVTSCGLLNRYGTFEGAYCFRLQR